MLPLYYDFLNESLANSKQVYFTNDVNSYFYLNSVDQNSMSYYEINSHTLPSNSVLPFYNSRGKFYIHTPGTTTINNDEYFLGTDIILIKDIINTDSRSYAIVGVKGEKTNTTVNIISAPYSSQFNPININKISSYNSFLDFSFNSKLKSILIQEDDIKIGDGFTQLNNNSDLLGALNSYSNYGEFVSSTHYIKNTDPILPFPNSESFQSILPFFEHSTHNIITLNSFESWNSTKYAPLLELTDFEFQTGQRAAFGVGRYDENGYNSNNINLFEVYFDTNCSEYNSVVIIDSGLDGFVYYNNYESVLKSQSNDNHNSILIQRTSTHGETHQYYIKSGNSDNSAEMYELTGGNRVNFSVSFKANSSYFGPFIGHSIGQYSDMFYYNSFYNSDGVTEITTINDFSKDMIVLNSSYGNSSWYIVTLKDNSQITLSKIENSQPDSLFIKWEFGLNSFLNINNSIVKSSEVKLNSVIYKLDESHYYIINSIENNNKVCVLRLQNSEQYVNSWHYVVSGYKTENNSFIYSSDAFQFIKDTVTQLQFITFNSSNSFMAIELKNNNSYEHFFQSMPFDDVYYPSNNIPTGNDVVFSSQSNSVTRIYYPPW